MRSVWEQGFQKKKRWRPNGFTVIKVKHHCIVWTVSNIRAREVLTSTTKQREEQQTAIDGLGPNVGEEDE